MRKGMKVLNAAVALAIGVMLAPNYAQADYSYTFTATGFEAGIGSASGTFALDSNPFLSGNANLVSASLQYNLGGTVYNFSGTDNLGGNVNIFPGANLYLLNISFPNAVNSDYRAYNVSINGVVRVTADGINGNVGIRDNISGDGSSVNTGDGIFSAFLSSAPSSGGGSGGAPSPEVNAFLGLALAGGTVAFLRRKRREPVASVA